MRDIKQAVLEHKKYILENSGYSENQLLGIFVYGSQNYGLNTELSDIDTKAIIIPTIDNLTFSPIKTKEYKLENGEHCELMSIVHFVENLKKQNINFVEVLYTEYCLINPLYQSTWEYFFINNREDIAHYNMTKCVQSILRTSYSYFKARWIKW